MSDWNAVLKDIYSSTQENIGQEFKYFMTKLNNNPEVISIFDSLSAKYTIDDQLELFAPKGSVQRSSSISSLEFVSKDQQMLCQRKILDIFYNSNAPIKNYILSLAKGTNNNQKLKYFIAKYIEPIINYIQLQIGNQNIVLSLLNRYKQRVQWFTKNELVEKYTSATKNYENILEHDLRLYLFDNGIQYPFSTPQLSKGRADIVGQVESDDPIIIEIKIFDKQKKYGINRVRDGFKQIVDYTTEYDKSIGYLIIYCLDNNFIEFTFNYDQGSYTSIEYNGKTYFIIVIYLGDINPSKLGSIESIKITRDEIVN